MSTKPKKEKFRSEYNFTKSINVQPNWADEVNFIHRAKREKRNKLRNWFNFILVFRFLSLSTQKEKSWRQFFFRFDELPELLSLSTNDLTKYAFFYSFLRK